MKKCMLIALITVFTLASFGACCFADIRRGVANTSKRGSLVVFPLVKVQGPNVDTIITLSNDFAGKVHMNCRYRTPKTDCGCGTVFSFDLTNGHPISWVASTGKGVDGDDIPSSERRSITSIQALGSEYIGELRCWAVKGSDPISWNYLSGTATVIEGPNQSWEYSAWRFAVGFGVQHNKVVPGSSSGGPHIMRMTGSPIAYDACPEKLLFNFVEQVADPTQGPYGSAKAENRVTLVPCKQDCVDTPPIQAKFWVWDEGEGDDSSGSCLGCGDNVSAFFSKSLSDSSKFYNPSAFINLGTPGGMAIVENKPTNEYSQCAVTYGVPLLGVISNKWVGPTGPVSGETPTTIGVQPELTNADGSRSGIEVEMTYP